MKAKIYLTGMFGTMLIMMLGLKDLEKWFYADVLVAVGSSIAIIHGMIMGFIIYDKYGEKK